MPKTNGCLVTGLCARNIFGGAQCEHRCDEEYQEEVVIDFFLALMEFFAKRVPPHKLKLWRKWFSENVYHPKGPRDGTKA